MDRAVSSGLNPSATTCYPWGDRSCMPIGIVSCRQGDLYSLKLILATTCSGIFGNLTWPLLVLLQLVFRGYRNRKHIVNRTSCAEKFINANSKPQAAEPNQCAELIEIGYLTLCTCT